MYIHIFEGKKKKRKKNNNIICIIHVQWKKENEMRKSRKKV